MTPALYFFALQEGGQMTAWRRLLVVALACGPLPAPLFSYAQPRVNVPRVGVLTLGLAPSSQFVEAFRQALREKGYVEGRSIAFEYRFAEGNLDKLPALAAELVRIKVDVIVTESTRAALSAKQATQTIPIVMAATGLDPVKLGLVASFNRPGGNVTGLVLYGPQLQAKRLQIFKDCFPDRKLVAVLYNAASPNAPEHVASIKSAAQLLGSELRLFEVRGPADLDAAFQAVAKVRPNAFITLSDGMLLGERTRIVAFASRNRLPGIFAEREFAESGALMSYGPNIAANFRRAAYFADRILKGTKPAELPVEEPAKLDFVINLKTAKALNLKIPSIMIAVADDVIR